MTAYLSVNKGDRIIGEKKFAYELSDVVERRKRENIRKVIDSGR